MITISAELSPEEFDKFTDEEIAARLRSLGFAIPREAAGRRDIHDSIATLRAGREKGELTGVATISFCLT